MIMNRINDVELIGAREVTKLLGVNKSKISIKEIQRRLGHKSEETTRRVYVHATDEMRRQSVEILNTMYG